MKYHTTVKSSFVPSSETILLTIDKGKISSPEPLLKRATMPECAINSIHQGTDLTYTDKLLQYAATCLFAFRSLAAAKGTQTGLWFPCAVCLSGCPAVRACGFVSETLLHADSMFLPRPFKYMWHANFARMNVVLCIFISRNDLACNVRVSEDFSTCDTVPATCRQNNIFVCARWILVTLCSF